MAIFLKKCIQKYPQIKTMILALKLLIQKSNLSNNYLGGLSGFTLAGMVIAYVQLHESFRRLNDSLPDLSIAELMINFLKEYGFL